MARNKDNYNPSPETRRMLERAWELVNSVPYQVSARWLFYGLLQEGYYNAKSDYKNKFMKALSMARHAQFEQWRPDTLADETRESIIRGHGYDTPKAWLLDLAEEIECDLAKWHTQEHYIELWFEARAMSQQFEHYTENITLNPMGGEPSIPYKYRIARFLWWASIRYKKPITVLYFGDHDPKGIAIAKTANADAQKWCPVPFKFVHCGLTLEQVRQYNVPENFEKPGTYQWEAVSDMAAKEIIETNIDKYVRHDAFTQVDERAAKATEWLRAKLIKLAEEYEEAA